MRLCTLPMLHSINLDLVGLKTKQLQAQVFIYLLISLVGAPVFVSKAHFLDADPYYLSLITGLSPNRTLHDTNVDVEPVSAV